MIAGGSRGLGLALARECAGQGARLALAARDPATLERARAELVEGGAEVLAVPCDVGDRARVEGFVRAAGERFGRIDVLVNNAGVIQRRPAGHIDPRRLRGGAADALGAPPVAGRRELC